LLRAFSQGSEEEATSVAKAGAKRERRGTGESGATRRRIVDAAIETLKGEGFPGTSARAIAETGGFSQALIFYHFGSVNDLLLAALDETSARRMAAYRPVVEDAGDLRTLIEAAADIYREDLAAGHIKVLAELIAGSSSVPGLGPEVAARVEPWRAFVVGVMARLQEWLPPTRILPPDDAAFAVVALYLGIELLTHLQGDVEPAERLFASARSFAPVLEALSGPPSRGG
jgi:AcrR family transcriptional regulator